MELVRVKKVARGSWGRALMFEGISVELPLVYRKIAMRTCSKNHICSYSVSERKGKDKSRSHDLAVFNV